MRLYLDTSAAAKLIVKEPESAALIEHLESAIEAGHDLVSSVLLETELRRVAMRQDLSQESVSNVLDRIQLALPDNLLYRDAGLLAGKYLRPFDALHIASALRLDAGWLITYDKVLAAAAGNHGLRTQAPG